MLVPINTNVGGFDLDTTRITDGVSAIVSIMVEN